MERRSRSACRLTTERGAASKRTVPLACLCVTSEAAARHSPTIPAPIRRIPPRKAQFDQLGRGTRARGDLLPIRVSHQKFKMIEQYLCGIISHLELYNSCKTGETRERATLLIIQEL